MNFSWILANSHEFWQKFDGIYYSDDSNDSIGRPSNLATLDDLVPEGVGRRRGSRNAEVARTGPTALRADLQELAGAALLDDVVGRPVLAVELRLQVVAGLPLAPSAAGAARLGLNERRLN